MAEKFSYVLENLALASLGMGELIIGTLFSLVSVYVMHWIFLYGLGYKLVQIDAAELKRKKETLSDLILMKDIQTELEKEVEKAMLKATFQG